MNSSTTIEEVRTGGWGMQIKSSKYILQFLDDDDNNSCSSSGKSKNNKDEKAVEAKEVFSQIQHGHTYSSRTDQDWRPGSFFK